MVKIIVDYGGENPRAADRIADVILMAREGLIPAGLVAGVTKFEGGIPNRTREFAALVAAAKGKEYQAMHPAKMTFQVGGGAHRTAESPMLRRAAPCCAVLDPWYYHW